jgi:ABC-type multidrug transport system fused ATPase/permease subunit
MLFRGTVADNIRLGDPLAGLDAVQDAARLAGADAFVSKLPDGYETHVGDGGRPVSPGERRRIALARAILRDAPLVILDEPAADLDPHSVELVGDAIERFAEEGRSVLLIAHRPELAERADRVVRIDDGRLEAPLGALR